MLKGLIDAIFVPTKTSQLENDSNYITDTELDAKVEGLKEDVTPVKGVDYFDGEDGKGIYVGDGDMPEDATVQIILEGSDDGLSDSVGLPEVTETDNGKILQVVGGTWQAAELVKYNGEHGEVI